MKVTVKLFATLRENRFSAKDFRFSNDELGGSADYINKISQPVLVQSITESLGISEKEAAIIMINGRHVELSHELADGDVLAIFPPIGGG